MVNPCIYCEPTNMNGKNLTLKCLRAKLSTQAFLSVDS